MNASELRKQSIAELQKLLETKRRDMVEQRRSLYAGELQNPRAISVTRHDIALILTVLNEQAAATTKAKQHQAQEGAPDA